jgi:hypothetical protein
MAYSSKGLTGEVFLPGEQTPDEQRTEVARDAKLSAFVDSLHEEARKRRAGRGGVEQRWLEDIRQFHGQYDHDTVRKLDEAKRSKVFINLTGPKTEAYEARLFDLLFPTDERNWGISPTPVPELSQAGKRIADELVKAKELADGQQAAMLQAQQQGNQPAAEQAEKEMRVAEEQENALMVRQEELHLTMQQAAEQAHMMEDRIADHLATCIYPVEARDVIQDACRIGLGVIKGPILGEKPKMKWQQGANGRFELVPREDQQPGVWRVDPWLFFPDPDVKRLSDSQGFYELHPMNKSQLRALAKRPTFRKEAIRELLNSEPDSSDGPLYLSDLHTITGQNDGRLRHRYMVWEYTGPVEGDMLQLLAEAFWEEETEGENEWTKEIDPLEEVNVRVWFCDGKVLSFALHPLDSQRPLYKAFTIREDETSPFGYGIPWMMRHPQSVLNGAYRMMMDNASLGTGPQIVVNKDAVEPEDGTWELKPRKVWTFKGASVTNNIDPFRTFDIPAHQKELTELVMLASQTIDEVTSMPQIAQGEQGAGVTKTAQGMALLLNSANVTFRRVVKNWDDSITTPVVSDLYDWEMQFGKDEAVKGDYDVVARGASVLLVREMQSQNLMFIATAFGDHPVYGQHLKHNELLKSIFRALMINAEEITLTETEVKEAQAGKQPQEDPKLTIAKIEQQTKMAELAFLEQKLQGDLAIAEMNADADKMVARMNYEGKMQEVANKTNLETTRMEADLAKANATEASKERVVAAEIAMQQQTGVSSGGTV